MKWQAKISFLEWMMCPFFKVVFLSKPSTRRVRILGLKPSDAASWKKPSTSSFDVL